LCIPAAITDEVLNANLICLNKNNQQYIMHTVKIRSIQNVTHDVLQIRTEKPLSFKFTPGQATDVSINKRGWVDEKRSFTFTCLPQDDFLEFTIKIYSTHKGVTDQLLLLHENDELVLHDVFGDIGYKGQGIFIAGGAGITPFISIFRDLHSKNELSGNKLIFANKTESDIINKEEFDRLLGKNFINVLQEGNATGYEHGFITDEIIRKNMNGHAEMFYVCGPPPMMEAVEKILAKLSINKNSIVKEAF
jgi:ferredoxin-NADP reductase